MAFFLSDSVPFVCVLTAHAARFTECSLSRAWRNKAIKESELGMGGGRKRERGREMRGK